MFEEGMIFYCYLCCKSDCFWIIIVYVDDWCLDYFGNISIEFCWVSIVWVWCGKVNLVIDYDVDCVIYGIIMRVCYI